MKQPSQVCVSQLERVKTAGNTKRLKAYKISKKKPLNKSSGFFTKDSLS